MKKIYMVDHGTIFLRFHFFETYEAASEFKNFLISHRGASKAVPTISERMLYESCEELTKEKNNND